MSASSDDELDETQIRFQEAHGERLFRLGKPRALLEVKSPDITTVIYEARLRGYDRAMALKSARHWSERSEDLIRGLLLRIAVVPHFT
jgi:hypothetical protein